MSWTIALEALWVLAMYASLALAGYGVLSWVRDFMNRGGSDDKDTYLR